MLIGALLSALALGACAPPGTPPLPLAPQGEVEDRARPASELERRLVRNSDPQDLEHAKNGRLVARTVPFIAERVPVVDGPRVVEDDSEVGPTVGRAGGRHEAGGPDEGEDGRWTAVLSVENFERRVFGNMVTTHLRRQWLGGRLDEVVATAVRGHRLDASQESKLRLAGRGDIHRFLASAAEKRREFEAMRADIRRATTYLGGLAPLAQAFKEGPFGDDSLFAKTLARMTEPRG